MIIDRLSFLSISTKITLYVADKIIIIMTSTRVLQFVEKQNKCFPTKLLLKYFEFLTTTYNVFESYYYF